MNWLYLIFITVIRVLAEDKTPRSLYPLPPAHYTRPHYRRIVYDFKTRSSSQSSSPSDYPHYYPRSYTPRHRNPFLQFNYEHQSEILPHLSVPMYRDCYSSDGITRHCQERSTCFFTFPLYTYVNSISTCQLPDGSYGVCCPSDDYSFAMDNYKVDDQYENLHVEDKRKRRDYQNAHDEAERFLKSFIEAKTIVDVTDKRLAEQRHQQLQYGTQSGLDAAQLAIILNEASRTLDNNEKWPNPKFTSLWGTSLENTCRKIPKCSLSPYRTIDGTCNNLYYPLWGSTNSGLHRNINPDYADGKETPRLAKNGEELPSGRYLSLKFIEDKNVPHAALSHLAMNFGQFVAHDISRVAVFTESGNKAIKCCTREILENPFKRHPACYPILLPTNDPRYLGERCMEFVRALPAQPDNCKLTTTRNPMNQVTHFLDGSFIYGSDEETHKKLRLKSGGLLTTSDIQGEKMLPIKNSSTCGSPELNFHCFEAGDIRVNQEPPILAMHVLFVREHNRIASILSQVKPSWNDETVFQEARRILVAKLQHITFNEFLPLFLDYETRRRHGLLLKSSGYSYNYDYHLKPNILSEFQAAAFRIGHSMVQNHFGLFHSGFGRGGHKFTDQFFNPSLFYTPGNLELILQGLALESAQNADSYFSYSMVRELFQKGKDPGLDIYAINIQRGRDTGVNGYNYWREYCGLSKAKVFSDFSDVIPYENVEKLKLHYKDVDDVDLYAAGVMETHIPGTIVGPTFSCIIANQFRRLRLGDRFWYERYDADEGVGFTPEQLREIRKSTFARIICDNTRITVIQPLPFIKTSLTNPSVDCSSVRIPLMSLRFWE